MGGWTTPAAESSLVWLQFRGLIPAQPPYFTRIDTLPAAPALLREPDIDSALVGPALLVGRGRHRLAVRGHAHVARADALARQILGHALRPGFAELVIVFIGAARVGVAHDLN